MFSLIKPDWHYLYEVSLYGILEYISFLIEELYLDKTDHHKVAHIFTFLKRIKL